MHFDNFYRELTVDNGADPKRIVKFSESGATILFYDSGKNSITHAKGLDRSVLLSFIRRHFLADIKFVPVDETYFNQFLIITP